MKVIVYGIVNLAIKPYIVVKGELAKENSYMVGVIRLHTEEFTQESTQLQSQGTKKKWLDQPKNREEGMLFTIKKQGSSRKPRQGNTYPCVQVNNMKINHHLQAELFQTLAQGLR